MKVGNAALGFLCGLLIGLFLALSCAAVGVLVSVSPAWWVLGTAMLFSVAFIVDDELPTLITCSVGTLLRGFLGGAMAEITDDPDWLDDRKQQPVGWLRILFWVGIAVGVVALSGLAWR